MKIIQSKKHVYDNKKFNSSTELRAYMILRKLLGHDEVILINQKLPNTRLELDIYLPAYNVGIEIQGPIHCLSFCTIRRDIQKFIFCKKLGIRIIYLPCNKITRKHIIHIKNDFTENFAKTKY